jgi:hypothetical protein
MQLRYIEHFWRTAHVQVRGTVHFVRRNTEEMSVYENRKSVTFRSVTMTKPTTRQQNNSGV